VPNLSIGFSVSEWRDDQNGRTATKSRLIEVSFVAIGGDPNAKVRSQNMPDIIDVLTPEQRVTRNKERRTLCRSLNLSQAFEDEALDSDWDNDEFNRRALAYVQARSYRVTPTRTDHNTETLDNPQVFKRAASEAITAHVLGKPPAEGPALELYQRGWDGLHMEMLRRAGQPTTGNRAEMITRALTTSDLPMISGPALYQIVMTQYTALLSPTGALFAPRTLQDFNPQREVLADWTGIVIDQVREHGEYQSTFIDDRGETYKLESYGAILGVSRQLWINGSAALGNMSTMLSRRLAAFVNDKRVAYIVQNSLAGPVMADTKAVSIPTVATFASLDTTDVTTVIDGVLAERSNMATRKGSGDVMIGATPRYWLVPAKFEPTAIRALATIAAYQAENVNPLSGKLELIMEPRLEDADTSYLVASTAAMEGAVQASLAGEPGPFTDSRWGWEVDALEFKVREDLGFGWPEWRFWTRLDHAPVTP
jgi:hypothetical protein